MNNYTLFFNHFSCPLKVIYEQIQFHFLMNLLLDIMPLASALIWAKQDSKVAYFKLTSYKNHYIYKNQLIMIFCSNIFIENKSTLFCRFSNHIAHIALMMQRRSVGLMTYIFKFLLYCRSISDRL